MAYQIMYLQDSKQEKGWIFIRSVLFYSLSSIWLSLLPHHKFQEALVHCSWCFAFWPLWITHFCSFSFDQTDKKKKSIDSIFFHFHSARSIHFCVIVFKVNKLWKRFTCLLWTGIGRNFLGIQLSWSQKRTAALLAWLISVAWQSRGIEEEDLWSTWSLVEYLIWKRDLQLGWRTWGLQQWCHHLQGHQKGLVCSVEHNLFHV